MYYQIIVLVMLAALTHGKTKIPTCDVLAEHGPIIVQSWNNGSQDSPAWKRSVKSLMSGTDLQDPFPKNWVHVEQIGPTIVIVFFTRPRFDHFNEKLMIVDLKTGMVLIDKDGIEQFWIDAVGSSHIFQARIRIAMLASSGFDMLVVAEVKTYKWSKVLVARLRYQNGSYIDSTFSFGDKFRYTHVPSVSMIDGKYCMIGGDKRRSIPIVCYNTSTLQEDISTITVNRALHASVVHLGVLYLCGGERTTNQFEYEASASSMCAVYNVTNVSIPCDHSFDGRMFVVQNTVKYINSHGCESQVDPPSNVSIQHSPNGSSTGVVSSNVISCEPPSKNSLTTALDVLKDANLSKWQKAEADKNKVIFAILIIGCAFLVGIMVLEIIFCSKMFQITAFPWITTTASVDSNHREMLTANCDVIIKPSVEMLENSETVV